ncbi:MAG: hypothetical protein NZ601_05320 [candidate division WOR-3 bacterium]|nr:hypothetical protein [candidate division WOR-3 bacterium]MCX7756958.1 hypothetical protein [candidate division WOR-3 bacterium]MDW7988246.1 hypothetical protein [candidate division WOR-3 bacterium]
MRVFEALAKIDRKIIFLILAVVIIVPLIKPIGLISKASTRAKAVFDAVESIPPGKPLMISIDFDPGSMPELYPMLLAILRHAFARDVKVIVLGLWLTGMGLGEQALTTVASEYSKKYGVDYVFLGWRSGVLPVVLGMGEDIKKTFPTDYYGTPLESLAMMSNIRNYRDIPFFISLSAGDPGMNTWIAYAQARYGLKMGAGTTAVSAADAYPYLQTGQLTGLLGGMKGAAEYEFLVKERGYSKEISQATQAMDSQSLAHLLILILIVLGNIGYLFIRKQTKKLGGAR